MANIQTSIFSHTSSDLTALTLQISHLTRSLRSPTLLALPVTTGHWPGPGSTLTSDQAGVRAPADWHMARSAPQLSLVPRQCRHPSAEWTPSTSFFTFSRAQTRHRQPPASGDLNWGPDPGTRGSSLSHHSRNYRLLTSGEWVSAWWLYQEDYWEIWNVFLIRLVMRTVLTY